MMNKLIACEAPGVNRGESSGDLLGLRLMAGGMGRDVKRRRVYQAKEKEWVFLQSMSSGMVNWLNWWWGGVEVIDNP